MSLRQKTSYSHLRHKLTLQQEVMLSDGQGGYSRSWQDIANLWAEVIALVLQYTSSRDSKTIIADAFPAKQNYRIILRYREGVTAGMRLVLNEKKLNILHVANIAGKNERLELMTEEMNSD